jgi:hypothetical protein
LGRPQSIFTVEICSRDEFGNSDSRRTSTPERRSARFLASDGATYGPNAAADQRARGWPAAGHGRYASPSAGTHQTTSYGPSAGRLTTAGKAGTGRKKHGEGGYPHGISPSE